MFHLSSLYQLTKTEQRTFQINHNELTSVLRQQNRSEGIYGYNVGNVNSKSKNFFFLLAFFLHHLNPYNSIKTIAVYFSRIIPKQITENINIHWYLNLYRNCLDTFPSDGRKWIRKGREKTKKVRFIYKTFICLETINNKFETISHNLMENKKDAEMSEK